VVELKGGEVTREGILSLLDPDGDGGGGGDDQECGEGSWDHRGWGRYGGVLPTRPRLLCWALEEVVVVGVGLSGIGGGGGS